MGLKFNGLILVSAFYIVSCNAELEETFPTPKDVQFLRSQCISNVEIPSKVSQTLVVSVDTIHEKGGSCTATWFEDGNEGKLKIESTFEVLITAWK